MKCKRYAGTYLFVDVDIQICHESCKYLLARRKHGAWEQLFTLTVFYGGKLCKNCQGLAETRQSVDLSRALVPVHYYIEPVIACGAIFVYLLAHVWAHRGKYVRNGIRTLSCCKIRMAINLKVTARNKMCIVETLNLRHLSICLGFKK